jgi:hypothetical protein
MKPGRKVARRLLSLLLSSAILALGGAVIYTAFHTANVRADLETAKTEAQALYDGFEKYFSRHASYPSSYIQRGFDVETLDPIGSRGYYDGHLLSKLRDHRADAYDSPDDRGQNQEFWIEMTLASEPTIRILVAKSDDAPMGSGEWLDGVYVFRRGELEPL